MIPPIISQWKILQINNFLTCPAKSVTYNSDHAMTHVITHHYRMPIPLLAMYCKNFLWMSKHDRILTEYEQEGHLRKEVPY